MDYLEVAILGLSYPTFNESLGRERFSELIEFFEGHEHLSIHGTNELINDSFQLNKTLERINWNDIDLVVIASATFSGGGHVLNIAESAPGTPILLWGFPEPDINTDSIELNSTCGMNMNASFLARLDRNYNYLYGTPHKPEIAEEANKLIDAYRLEKQTRGTKLCLVSNRVPGFFLSNVDELSFRNDFGIEISHLALSSLERGMKKQPIEEVKKELEEKKDKLNEVRASESQLEKSIRAYLFLKDYANKNGIDGFAIKCWPEIPDEFGFSICSAVSWLNSEDIPIGCEGDIPGLTTMLLERWATGKVSALMDLVNVNHLDNQIKAWHCGGTGADLACDSCGVNCGAHPTIPDTGPAMNFNLKEGAVTLARLDQFPNYNQLFVVEGVAVKDQQVTSGNSVLLEFPDYRVKDILDSIMSEGVGHHYALVYGKVRNELEEFCKNKDITLLPEKS